MFVQIEHGENQMAGLGVGLTLSKQLIEMHGGKIEVRSGGNGKGCEFLIRLPIVIDAVELQNSVQEDAAGTDERKLRVLVVDDNLGASHMLSTLVKKLGHDVKTAGNGSQAVSLAAEFRPQVILMDLGMPEMDGYQAAQLIRRETWGKEILLIALTGWGQEADRQRTKQTGFDYHIVKPLGLDELKTALARQAFR